MNKPTEEELKNYYSTNRKYFDELANYYYKTDLEFYTKYFAPFYSQHQAGEVVCPYCRKSMVPFDYPSLSPSRIALFVSGAFQFLCGLYLAYFFSVLLGMFFLLISIAFIITGFFFKKIKKRCSNCRMPIPYLLIK